MATTNNKYGRQIFLSRKEIQFLRGLVENKMIGISDDISLSESYLEYEEPGSKMAEQYKEQIQEAKDEFTLCERLIGEGTSDSGKLWYYVSAEEADNG